MEITPTIVDVAVVVIILISAFLAYSRGLTREVFTLGVWIAAAGAAVAFYPKVVPFIQDIYDLGSLTKWAAVVIVFVIALIILSVLASTISSLISNSALGGIDRGLGFLFGALRGLLLLAVAWILFEEASPSTLETAAVEESQAAGVVAETAGTLRGLMPDEMPPFMQSAMEDLLGKPETEEEPETAIPGSTIPTETTD